MTDDLKFDLLEVLVKHNIIPENYLRDEKIRTEHSELKSQGVPVQQAQAQLALKYCTSKKNIEYIVYAKKKFQHE